MLKLPGRGKKREHKGGAFSPYKNFIRSIHDTKKELKEEIKEPVRSATSFGTKAEGTIRFNDVEKRFGSHVVLQSLTFEIPTGKIFGVIGVSGSGKTTLLRLIVGYYLPTKGSISFSLKENRKSNIPMTKHFGFATQDNSFYGDLTAEENVRFFGTLYGLKPDVISSRVADVLSVVELYDSRNELARNLSGGMRRRLDLACALVHDPSVLILDEPTEDLDPILRRELLRLIKKINSFGTTIIFTTHVLSEAEFLCDNIAILSNQKVFTIGTSDDLRKMYRGGEELHLTLEDTRRYDFYVKKLKGFKPKIVDGRLVIYVPVRGKAAQILRSILSLVERQGDHVVFADIRRPSLSKIFTSIIENSQNAKKKKGKS